MHTNTANVRVERAAWFLNFSCLGTPAVFTPYYQKCLPNFEYLSNSETKKTSEIRFCDLRRSMMQLHYNENRGIRGRFLSTYCTATTRGIPLCSLFPLHWRTIFSENFSSIRSALEQQKKMKQESLNIVRFIIFSEIRSCMKGTTVIMFVTTVFCANTPSWNIPWKPFSTSVVRWLPSVLRQRP